MPSGQARSVASSVIATALLLWAGGFSPVAASAADTNGAVSGYAWSNQTGWINFGASEGKIKITNTEISGYAWGSSAGWINLSPSQGGVRHDGLGHLSGFAWGERLGSIDFSGVTIDALGKFHGQATGKLAGIITFDCDYCGVTTDWRQAPAAGAPAPSGNNSFSSPGVGSPIIPQLPASPLPPFDQIFGAGGPPPGIDELPVILPPVAVATLPATRNISRTPRTANRAAVATLKKTGTVKSAPAIPKAASPDLKPDKNAPASIQTKTTAPALKKTIQGNQKKESLPTRILAALTAAIKASYTKIFAGIFNFFRQR